MKHLLLAISMLLLIGCGEEHKRKATFHTVEYYVKNKEARESRKKECEQMQEVTEAIARDCGNVDIAINRTRPSGGTLDFSDAFR